MIGRKLAKHNLEERRLAAAVGSDHADAFTLVHAERDVCQDILVSVMDGYVSEIKQLYILLVVSRINYAMHDHLVAADLD